MATSMPPVHPKPRASMAEGRQASIPDFITPSWFPSELGACRVNRSWHPNHRSGFRSKRALVLVPESPCRFPKQPCGFPNLRKSVVSVSGFRFFPDLPYPGCERETRSLVAILTSFAMVKASFHFCGFETSSFVQFADGILTQVLSANLFDAAAKVQLQFPSVKTTGIDRSFTENPRC